MLNSPADTLLFSRSLGALRLASLILGTVRRISPAERKVGVVRSKDGTRVFARMTAGVHLESGTATSPAETRGGLGNLEGGFIMCTSLMAYT